MNISKNDFGGKFIYFGGNGSLYILELISKSLDYDKILRKVYAFTEPKVFLHLENIYP